MPTQCLVCEEEVDNPAEWIAYQGRHRNCACGFGRLTAKEIAVRAAETKRGECSYASLLTHIHPPSGLAGPHRKEM